MTGLNTAGDLVSIGIDTGGTFTDGFLVDGAMRLQSKVPTTPHDLTECFIEILESLAGSMEIDLRDLLRRTGVIRYASTVGTNALIQHTGPKLGLITTTGSQIVKYFHEAEDTQWLLSTDLLREIDEQTLTDGSIGKAIDRDQVRRVAEEIVDQGARAIAISLSNSAFNAENERAVRQVIRSEYLPSYLGSVPVLTAHDVTIRIGDLERTNAVLLSAYLRPDLVKYLYKAEEFLRSYGYNRPLLIAHSTGGVARIAKSTPLQTYNSGPVSGLLGSLEVATTVYHHDDVVTLDMGGTSLDIGLIAGSKIVSSTRPLIAGVPVNVPMVELGIFGAGGGSIASVASETEEIRVGPLSAGAVPGPAAYGLGGVEPTVTDANLILGYLNASNFLGGRRRLHYDLAEKAFSPMAASTEMDVASVAWEVKCVVERNITKAIAEQLNDRQVDVGGMTIYAFGGAAGIHSASIARELGCSRVVTYPFGSVFCAAGVSTLDVLHIYERSLFGEGIAVGDRNVSRAAELAAQHWQAAVRDMRGEGYSEDSIDAVLQLETDDAQENNAPELELVMFPDGVGVSEIESRINDVLPDGQSIRVVRLVARRSVTSPEFPELAPSLSDVSAAISGSRDVYWDGAFQDTPVYDSNLLGIGHVIEGPAVLESEFTTVIVPSDCRFKVDKFGMGILEVGQ